MFRRAPEMTPALRCAATMVLSASLLVITMDMTVLSLALPEMAADLKPSANGQLWIVDVYSLMLAGLLIPGAALADRWGRKRMLLVGYTIFAIASLLVLIADTTWAVIAVRGFLGLGGSVIMPTTLSLIRVIFTNPAERAKALGVWAAVSGLGAAVGPLVGGVLLEYFSWHAAFLVNVPLMAAGIVAGLWVLPESKLAHPGRLDLLAAVCALVGMTTLVWGIKQFGAASSLAVPKGWFALLIAAVALASFVVRCLRSNEPLLDLSLFRNRALAAGIVAALGAVFSMIAALVLIAQWLQVVHGSSPIRAGIELIPMAIAAAVASMAAPALAARIGARRVLAGGLAVAAVGMVILGTPASLSLTVVLISLTIVGLGTGSLAIGSALIMSGSPEEKAGNAGALEETSYELGGTLGIAVLGSVSALIYRADLGADAAYRTLSDKAPDLADGARESLGAAATIADNLAMPALRDAAGAAFGRSLEVTGIVGGIIMAAVAVTVYVLAPRNTNITAEP